MLSRPLFVATTSTDKLQDRFCLASGNVATRMILMLLPLLLPHSISAACYSFLKWGSCRSPSVPGRHKTRQWRTVWMDLFIKLRPRSHVIIAFTFKFKPHLPTLHEKIVYSWKKYQVGLALVHSLVAIPSHRLISTMSTNTTFESLLLCHNNQQQYYITDARWFKWMIWP